MDLTELRTAFPLGLASVAMDLDKFEYLSDYETCGIGRLELTPLVTDNQGWRLGDPDSRRGFREQCARHKVRVESVHAYFLPEHGHDMADADPVVRQNAIALNQKMICAASELNPRYFVVHLFNEQLIRSEDEALSIARKAILALLPPAEETGIALAVENLQGGWSVRQINMLLDDLQHPLLGICLDTGHTVLYNQLDDEIKQCGRRLLGLHIHDNDLRDDDHLIPFRGKIDWRSFAMALRQIGYRGPLMFESFNRRANEGVSDFIAACEAAYRKLLILVGEAKTPP